MTNRHEINRLIIDAVSWIRFGMNETNWREAKTALGVVETIAHDWYRKKRVSVEQRKQLITIADFWERI